LLVELMPGVTGMVPKSEFDPAHPPAVGETVNVKILSVVPSSRRITASILKAAPDAEQHASETDAQPVEAETAVAEPPPAPAE
jgi:ribosomal protein S1